MAVCTGCSNINDRAGAGRIPFAGLRSARIASDFHSGTLSKERTDNHRDNADNETPKERRPKSVNVKALDYGTDAPEEQCIDDEKSYAECEDHEGD